MNRDERRLEVAQALRKGAETYEGLKWAEDLNFAADELGRADPLPSWVLSLGAAAYFALAVFLAFRDVC